MDISIVVPTYNEANNISALYERINNVLSSESYTWEIIFVDDGSTDNTYKVICDLHQRFSEVQGLRLSRNFGHQLALIAGMQFASGDAVITIDADLEYPPELIPELIAQWRKGYAIVHTIRIDKQNIHSLFKRLTSRLFYKLFKKLSGIELMPGMADYRLFDKRAVQVLASSKEHRPFLRGLSTWMGFTQTSVSFQPGKRAYGKSRYTLRKMLRLAISGIAGFSDVPLYLSLALGAICMFFSLGFGVYSLIVYFVLESTIQGFPSTVLLLTTLMGVQFIILGILGIYIGEILHAVRGRPNLLVEQSTMKRQVCENCGVFNNIK
ncbi:MAG: glycosyltransferase family 2 protein [Deltaproteobacteria bacterium]|nr:glycosyltransferase family 2 protein [Deltaproteobacteria bacterium]